MGDEGHATSSVRHCRARSGAWPQRGLLARFKPPCSAETRLSRSSSRRNMGARGKNLRKNLSDAARSLDRRFFARRLWGRRTGICGWSTLDRTLPRSSCLARCSSCGGAALPRRYVSGWDERGPLCSSQQRAATVTRHAITLVAWYRCYAPRAGGAYDSHHRTAGIAGRTRQCGGGVAARGERVIGHQGDMFWHAHLKLARQMAGERS